MTEPVLWAREDHTEAKHNLLLAFFHKWVSVHSGFFTARGRGLVRVYDGFAGPGIYEGGEPGSPAILLQALLDNPNLLNRWLPVRYEFRFVEQDPRRAAKLEEVLSGLEEQARERGTWTERIDWSVRCGRYEDNVPASSPPPSALFLFLDPFGYSHSPMTLTTELVQQPKSDTLIFLPLSFVHRFVGREGQDEALDRFFGTWAWRDVRDGDDRPAELLKLFRRQLVAAGLRYTGAFRLKTSDRRNQYWIVGASDDRQGYESIKEGFWAVDPVNGEGFVSARPAPLGQQSLELDLGRQGPDTRALLDGLRERFGSRTFSVEDAEEFTSTTKFLRSHLRERTLAPAEKEGILKVVRPAGARRFKAGVGIRMHFV